MNTTWRRCSTCKEEIEIGEEFLQCTVTTCNRKGRESVFCSVECWGAHVPVMNHKDAGYVEALATAQESPSPNRTGEKAVGDRKSLVNTDKGESKMDTTETPSKEIMIVVSKLKDYIQKSAGMNTSGSVPEVLTQILRRECDKAIENAKASGRKTVMDRDFSQ